MGKKLGAKLNRITYLLEQLLAYSIVRNRPKGVDNEAIRCAICSVRLIEHHKYLYDERRVCADCYDLWGQTPTIGSLVALVARARENL